MDTEDESMNKLRFLAGIAALFLTTGTAHSNERSIDEITLDLALSSSLGLHPHPEDIAGAVHYAAGTYPYPYELTNDDMWALRTKMQMLKLLPPVEYDHPFAGDLYIVDGKGKCITDISIACADPHDTWCLISYEKERVVRSPMTINLVIRHEIAHCNGWPGDHRGARYGVEIRE
jgi:hypothetical protein